MSRLHESLVAQVPQLRRGMVYCHSCGRSQRVDAGKCLARGWPTCCNQTMSIDSFAERRKLSLGGTRTP